MPEPAESADPVEVAATPERLEPDPPAAPVDADRPTAIPPPAAAPTRPAKPASEPAPPPAAAVPEVTPTPAPPPAPPPAVAAVPDPAPAVGEPAAGGSAFRWPVDGRLIGRYGPSSGGGFNDGIDIAAEAGTPIVAAADGTVAYAGNELRGYGNLLLIRHAGGWVTAYAHTDRMMVDQGESVVAGQVIATVGSSGSISQPMLHFEIRRGSDAVDPLDHLP